MTIARPSLFRGLLSLVSASLTPHAAEYGLQLSVLLKGARGTGKTTTVYDVARHLGMHVLEVIYGSISQFYCVTEIRVA